MKHTTIAFAVILAASASAQWTVVNLHPAGATASYAFGVGGGQQVGLARVGGVDHAMLWSGTAASRIDLHPAGAASSVASGVANGQQVGTISGGLGSGGLWTGNAGSFVDLTPPGSDYSWTSGVDNGQQVGQATVGIERHAVLWSGTPASWIDLNPAGSTESYAYAIADGQQVGFARIADMDRAGMWSGTSASWVVLHPPSATRSVAYATDNGQQGGIARIDGAYRASLWNGTSSSWKDLSPPGSIISVVWGVHGGQQVGSVSFGPTEFPYHASLWNGSAASWTDLHEFLPSEFQQTVNHNDHSEAQGIWHDGAFTYVVGNGFNDTTGRREALMWVSRAVAPTSYSMFRGSVFSGNLASLQNSDDNRLVMRPGITLGTSQPPIQIILNATAPTASPDGFSFSLESSASFGNAQQKISLYNFITGLYEELDARLAKTTDDTVTVTVQTNPSRFIEPGTLAIRALVSFRAVGPSLAFPWSGRIDKVWWTFPG